MLVNKLCITSVTLILLINLAHSDVPYTFPDPTIEIFKKGFRFSIPHEEGIELFAFHGNINLPMNGLEAGQFSKDILKKCGNHWVFDDLNEELAIGDSIHFWLFVIRNKLGYRYDDGQYVVKEITELRPSACSEHEIRKQPEDKWYFEAERSNEHRPIIDVHRIDTPITVMPTKKEDQEEAELTVCCDLFLNVTYRVLTLAKENKRLIAENEVLWQLAQKDEYYSTTLKLFGKYPTKYYAMPKQFVQNLILEKLLLEDVKVIEAKTIPDNGISFKVEKLSDKVKVIMAAKKGLNGSNYDLIW